MSDIRVDFDGFSQVILGGFVVHFCLHGAHTGDFEKALHAILFDAEAEAAVAGGVTEASAAAAGNAAVEDCLPLSKNAYKVEIARTMVKRTLLRLIEK